LADVFYPPGSGSGGKLDWSWVASGFYAIPKTSFTDAQDVENLGKADKAFLGKGRGEIFEVRHETSMVLGRS